jgi:hypothetical protein
VDAGVDVVQDGAVPVRLGDVGLDDVHSVGHELRVPAAQVVDDDDLMAVHAQLRDGDRADVAGAAGHEHAHPGSFRCRR